MPVLQHTSKMPFAKTFFANMNRQQLSQAFESSSFDQSRLFPEFLSVPPMSPVKTNYEALLVEHSYKVRDIRAVLTARKILSAVFRRFGKAPLGKLISLLLKNRQEFQYPLYALRGNGLCLFAHVTRFSGTRRHIPEQCAATYVLPYLINSFPSPPLRWASTPIEAT